MSVFSCGAESARELKRESGKQNPTTGVNNEKSFYVRNVLVVEPIDFLHRSSQMIFYVAGSLLVGSEVRIEAT